MFRIVLNLVANAVRAVNGRGGGVVGVDVRRGTDGRVLIRIRDEGPGLVGGACRAGRMQVGRSGLGLVIAEALAAGLGGTLHLMRSSPGGTSLHLVLPERSLSRQP